MAFYQCIKLSGGGSSGGNYYLNTIYSTEEKKVGYWTDGKPLYEKVVKSTTTPTANAWNTVALPADISVKIYDAYYVRTTGAIDKFSVYRGDANPAEMLVCTISNSTAYYRISSQYVANFSEFVIVIQYTKTADTPEPNPQVGNVIYLPTIYSEEERQVGVWKDGRPLYQITLNPTVSVGDNTIAHNIANLRECVSIFGECKYNNLTEYLPLPYVSKNIRFAISLGNVTPTTFLIGVGDGFSSIQDCFVTLQYTKTTDTAGSGEWVPSGAPAVHYSTNEQIVGTWIDGKPLYEKTFVQQLSGTAGTIDISALNVSEAFIDGGFYDIGVTNLELNEWVTQNDNTYAHVNKGLTPPVIDMRCTWANATATIVLRYTKTTD